MVDETGYQTNDVEIIPNTKEDKNKFHSRYYGGDSIVLTKEQIKALLNGKCLAFHVNSEYTITLETEGETK